MTEKLELSTFKICKSGNFLAEKLYRRTRKRYGRKCSEDGIQSVEKKWRKIYQLAPFGAQKI